MNLNGRDLRAPVVAVLIGLCPYPALATMAPVITPTEAIERAVAERFGAGVRVQVTKLDTDVAGEPALQAVPDPAARTGQPVRYQMVANGVRRGAAVASVQVLTQYARAARAIERGETITGAELDILDGALPDMAFRHLPTVTEIVGLRARRAIAIGEALTPAVLDVPPLVHSGERVAVTVSLGLVQVVGTGTASGSGYVGDIIRITQPESRRLLRARITGPAAVEVIP